MTWGRGLLARLISLEVIDRSLVVGAQAFSALIPLLIVIAGVGAGDGRSFADALIDRFNLKGDTPPTRSAKRSAAAPAARR